MPPIPRTAFAALIAIATLSAPSPAADTSTDGDTMRIRSATLLERTRRSGDRFHVLTLAGRFVATDALRTFLPRDDDVVVSVGGREVLRASQGDPAGRFAARRLGVWTWRGRDPEDRRVRSSLLLDLRRGAFRARVRGADLGELVGQGLDDVVVTLDLGDVSLHATLDFTRGRRGWRFRSRAPVPPSPGNGSGGSTGGGGGGTVPPGPVTFRRLGGEFYGGTPAAGITVARSQAQFTGLWTGRSALPVPAVDFTREMVVFVDMGSRISGGYAITVTGVRSSTSGLTVDWTETRPGSNCVVTTAITQAWQTVAVPLTSAQVTGNRSLTIQTCP